MNDYKNWLHDFKPSIPTAFENALSYYEEMRVLYYKVKQALEYMQSQESQIRVMVTEITTALNQQHELKVKRELRQEFTTADSELEKRLNAKINSLDLKMKTLCENLKLDIGDKLQQLCVRINRNKNAISDLEQELSRFKLSTNERFQLVYDYIRENLLDKVEGWDDKFFNLSNQFSALLISFNQFKEHVLTDVDERIHALSELVEQQIEKMNGDILMVRNPVTGSRTTLRQALQDLYDYRILFPVTADQLDSCKITAEELDSLTITADDFDAKALIYLQPWLNGVNSSEVQKELDQIVDRIDGLEEKVHEKWVSGLTGLWTSPYQCYMEVINFMITHHGNPITVTAFDNLQLTADDFDLKNISAYDLTWNGANVLQ